MTWTFFPVAEFAAHAGDWQQLNDDCNGSPLRDVDFVQPLVAEFAPPGALLARYERNGRLMAMAIVHRRGFGKWETFQPSQAPIGIWIQHPELDTEQLMSEMVRALPGLALVFGVTQRDPWLTPRPADTKVLQTLDYVDTARITIQGSFEDYWNARGKNLRSNLKKQRNKLQKEGVNVRMQIDRAPEAVAAAIADYGRLESAGWKAGQGTAIHPDNAQGRFYRAMLENFCRAGKGSILRYWFDDKVVAMNLCIEGHGALIVLKTTYDESYNTYSPAFLMREETCKQMFDEQQFKTLEFYGKVMEWHLRWTDEVRTLYHVNTYRWPALLQLRTHMKNRAAAREQLRPALPAMAAQGTPSTE